MAETITASVGTSPAPNRFLDVETVQSLLNQVPPDKGGPSPLLDVDGIIGPLTIAAIRKFQKHHFNWQDGRVDPNNKTLAKLNEFDLDPAIGNSIKFVEDKPNNGFDATTSKSGAAPWQMVPLAGFKFVKMTSFSKVKSVTSNNPGIARVLLVGSAIQVFGVSPGKTLIKARDATGRVLARLDVTVKRKKTVATFLHFVKDKTGRRTKRTSSNIGDGSTSMQSLLDGMNAIWTPQANVEFTLQGFKDPQEYSKNDFGDAVRFTAHLPGVAAKEHEWDIVVARRVPGADFNVFFVWEYSDNMTGDGAEAGTLANVKSCLCDDDLAPGLTVAETVAHEAGHLLGLPHLGGVENLMGEVGGATQQKLIRSQIDRANP